MLYDNNNVNSLWFHLIGPTTQNTWYTSYFSLEVKKKFLHKNMYLLKFDLLNYGFGNKIEKIEH